ncbi:MAG TPA: lipid-A-disaccharide synthase N-terminal domain-containing protein [Hyphomicrobiaceae bacterium]|nr:lipid-A-disaccharide synthase N-terminal domain-containing protein [Hyphomicrobiaceae bacterium]
MDFLATAATKTAAWWTSTPTAEKVWLAVGFVAQLMFSMRFIVQWIASERARRSIVPETFWYFSLAGGALLFAYAIYRLDPVFMLGQGMGLFIYARNLHFILRSKRLPAAPDGEVAGRQS